MNFVKKTFGFLKMFFICTITALIIWPIYFVLLYKFVPVPYTPLMIQRDAEYLLNGKEIECSKTWVSYDNINPDMARAVIASEDNLYLKHDGIYWPAIKAAYHEAQRGRRVRGGSTISQQCAKNVFLPHVRSYVRKAYEAYLTYLIEIIWGKRRIMEVYLNVIETGPGVYGVEAAAQKYFHTSAKKMSKQQCALIAACLPNPRKFLLSRPSGYMIGRREKIIYLMPKIGKLEGLD